jgi:copper transport protein
MDIDKKSGYIWIDEVIGKIAKLDPLNYNITEYAPSGNYNLKLPVAVKSDPKSGTVYIAEHGEDAVFAFYSSNDTFKRLPLYPDQEALPFGMSFDKQGNLWIAQHTVNKVAVIDPRTDESREVEIPSTNPLTQWITSDSEGNIWIAEPGSASLGIVNQTS